MNLDTSNFQQRILYRLQVAARDSIDLGMCKAYTENDIERIFTDRLTYTLRSHIWSEKREGDIATYPANWIEAFKERWFPKWLKEKYPVRYITVKSSFTIKYPAFRPAVSEPTCIVMNLETN